MESHVTQACFTCGEPMNPASPNGPFCPDCEPRSRNESATDAQQPVPIVSSSTPWSLGMALAVLVFFMVSMTFIPGIVVMMWAHMKGVPLTEDNMQQIATDPQANLFGIAAIGIVHMLTFLVAWTLITGRGRRFSEVVKWSWHPRFRLIHAVGIVVLLYAVAWVLQGVIPGGETEFDGLLKSSQSVRITISLLAVVSAPLVEEMVYRGILYPSLAMKLGRVSAVVAVSGLFALVHFPQYAGSLLILVCLTLLSFVLTSVRALTDRLLPCYVIHFLYNLVGSALILVEY